MALPQMRKVQGKKVRVKIKVIITRMTAAITMKIMKITAAIMTAGTMTAMTVSIESLLKTRKNRLLRHKREKFPEKK